MAFTNIISGTIRGSGNIISTDASFISILSKFQVRYNGTGSWLECSNTNNITGKSNCSFELKLKDGETLTTMQDMFWKCSSLTSLDLSNLDTSSVTNMQSVFNNCSSLTSLNVSNFNTSQVTTMNSMFFNCSSLISLDLSSFDTSQVTNMLTIFQDCTKLTSLDLSNFDTNKVTNMNNMFYNCPVSDIGLLYATSSTINSLVTQLSTPVAITIYYQQASLSDLTKQNNITYVFIEPTPIAKYKFNSNLYADYLPTFNSEFTGYTKTDINNDDGTITRIISHDTLKPTFMRFGSTGNSTNREKSLLEVIECDGSQITSTSYMFNGCTSLTSLNLSNLNTSQVTNMSFMFNSCPKLTSLDMSNFDTSQVTNMANMFNSCNKLTSLDLSNFDTSKVASMNSMFAGCSSLTSLDVSNFNTSQVTNMSATFGNCSSLTSLDLSNFDTSKVTDMSFMFRFSSSLISLDLSNWNTNKLTNMANMFDGCTSLVSLDLSNFDTDKVTNMNWAFYNCPVPDIGLLYATSSTINSLLTPLGTDIARNIYYTDAPLNELTVQNNITYKKYELSKATLPYTLNKLPNGVADYIDVVNKVHVQRVGVFFADGSETYAFIKYNSDLMTIGFGSSVSDNKNSVLEQGFISDKLPFNKNCFDSMTIGYRAIGGSIPYRTYCVIDATPLETKDLLGLQKYLASNPITILYELATPIYTPLTDEEIAQLPLSAYKDGYVNLSSDQLMPSFEFRMKASNRYQVDMLETGYYYLNAPVGNVKLGTTNVDVQQMPCIVKVDNVGTGDGGYRLGVTNGFCKDVKLTIDGYYLNIYNGELLVNSPRATSDYVYIDYYENLCVENLGNRTYFDMVFYDENKNYISFVSWDEVKNYGKFKAPQNAKYFRVSIVHEGNKIIRMYSPITLAKLPSHRIPTSFTQGMKCGTDFGCWEGIKESKFDRLWTTNYDWSLCDDTELSSPIQLNRIEYNNTIVEDEFDIATGKLTRRIGKYTINGNSNIWGYNTNVYETSTHMSFGCSQIPNFKKAGRCIGFLGIKIGVPNSTNSEENWHNLGVSNALYFRFRKDRYSYYGTGADGVKAYFNVNPTTIYYELEVPEISYLTPTKNIVKTSINSQSIQTTVNNGYLNPQVKPSHLTYPVPSLVGNRTYTVVHNRKNIASSTKPIELNLGGTVVQLNDASSKTLVKTPSTLAHNNLIFIGGESTVDHIMVLDGDWTNKPIEYFENMMGHDTDAIITIIGNSQIDDVEEQYLW